MEDLLDFTFNYTLDKVDWEKMFLQADRLKNMNQTMIGKAFKGMNMIRKGISNTANSLGGSNSKKRDKKKGKKSNKKSKLFGGALGKTVAFGVGGLSLILASAYTIAKSQHRGTDIGNDARVSQFETGSKSKKK